MVIYAYLVGAFMFGILCFGFFGLVEAGPGNQDYKRANLLVLICAILWPISLPMVLIIAIYFLVYATINL